MSNVIQYNLNIYSDTISRKAESYELIVIVLYQMILALDCVGIHEIVSMKF